MLFCFGTDGASIELVDALIKKIQSQAVFLMQSIGLSVIAAGRRSRPHGPLCVNVVGQSDDLSQALPARDGLRSRQATSHQPAIRPRNVGKGLRECRSGQRRRDQTRGATANPDPWPICRGGFLESMRVSATWDVQCDPICSCAEARIVWKVNTVADDRASYTGLVRPIMAAVNASPMEMANAIVSSVMRASRLDDGHPASLSRWPPLLPSGPSAT
jgi:hypothetical protein